ncbi:MAG: 2-C-methyl-D-erythritol 4-phosphate cytidylyltransferase [Gammaproteobacteria bacterium]
MESQNRYWAIVPAAGAGKRMQSGLPKQYLKIGDLTIIEHTLTRLSSCSRLSGIVVAISDDDPYWERIELDSFENIMVVPGGEERCHSVLNALSELAELTVPNDWVLVHDAARPCLRLEDIEKLIKEISCHPVGGILGFPVSDTLKRTDGSSHILETVDRKLLWRALTPQMFRLGELRDAIEVAVKRHQLVTDEASAMELVGKFPRIVEGHPDNIKITLPEDLDLASMYIIQQTSEH